MVDTHCHIDLYENPYEVLDEYEKLGIIVLAMTNLPSHFEKGYPHILKFKKARIALGFHPLYANSYHVEFPLFQKFLDQTSYIGEVGLDFSKDGYASKDMQIYVFRKILESINGKRKILSLHSKRSEREVLAFLIEYNIQSAIFHWYSGPLNLIDDIANSGYYFSVNTFMINSESGKKIIKKIPLNRILTETDGPFVMNGNRIVDAKDIAYIEEELANLRGIKRSEISSIISNNFKNLISSIK